VRATASRAAKDAFPASFERAVADFGAELGALGFDPDAEGQLAAAVAEYREAVAAHDRATALLRRTPDSWRDGKIHRVLKVGRAALDRWYVLSEQQPAPMDARPATAPMDAPPPAPKAAPADAVPRFRYSGTGRPTGKTELAIERPEPGLPTVARIVMKKHASIAVRPRTYIGDEFTTGAALFETYGPIDRLALLADGPTHLVVDSQDSDQWSIEMLPLDQVPVLRPGSSGKGATVLCHRGETPADLVFDVNSEYWSFSFQPLSGRVAKSGPSGSGEARKALQVPPRCLVVLTLVGKGDWSFAARG
jgi:hypothetical protein